MDEENRTEHGDNIADQIQTADAFGAFNVLTEADVWNILDNLHTHFLDQFGEDAPVLDKLERCMKEFEG